ncbi:MAG: 50S ribosomal protein L11 methyltransferase [Nitrospira sp.]|nr:50S ribosomal protein L11 methyltransferase [Nitrospira sp.]
MMTNGWVDVCIHGSLDTGELLSRLDDATVQGAWEDGGEVHLYWAETQWTEERLSALHAALADLASSSQEPSLSVMRVPAQDWNEAWARSVKPLRIGRFIIRPSWEPVTLGPRDLEIILDPKQAFGTGHHATTRMLLEWLQGDIRGGEQILDVGTGSAILAMAAVKLGASSAIGVEIDAVAVDCAREYVELNHLADKINVVTGTLADLPQSRTTPDFVLANLDRQAVLGLAEDLVSLARCGARIHVSGILSEQRDEIVERFSDLGLVCPKQQEAEGWVALAFLRLESCEGEA